MSDHQCPECGIKFSSLARLDNHRPKHGAWDSRGRMYQCLDCLFQSHTPAELNDHIDLHHNEGYGMGETEPKEKLGGFRWDLTVRWNQIWARSKKVLEQRKQDREFNRIRRKAMKR
jgi:hypothetical protein